MWNKLFAKRKSFPTQDVTEEERISEIQKAMKSNTDLNERQNGFTRLHWAANRGHVNAAKMLIANHADINAKGRYGETPLLMAISNRWAAVESQEIVQLLIDKKADLNAMDDDGWTPLYAACVCGSLEIAKLLLNNNVPVNQVTTFNDTPLQRAMRQGHHEMVELLKKYGADEKLPPKTKKCAVCGQILQEEVIACPQCGFGAFETHKVEYKSEGISVDKLRETTKSSQTKTIHGIDETRSLISILSEAYEWGKNNRWPIYEKYPQYQGIRDIGEKVYRKGSKEAMQATYYHIRTQNFELADMLNHFWHGVGSWLA